MIQCKQKFLDSWRYRTAEAGVRRLFFPPIGVEQKRNRRREKEEVGDRCEVEPGEKRGFVKYVGRAETIAPGFWIGVQYDEPLGKHDGLVRGTRYFECPPLHGALVRPDKVKVGDYPERDIFEEDEI